MQQLKAPSTGTCSRAAVPSGALENPERRSARTGSTSSVRAGSGAGCTPSPAPSSGGCCAAGPGRWRQPRPGKVAGIEVRSGLRRRQASLTAMRLRQAQQQKSQLRSGEALHPGVCFGHQAASDPRPPARRTGRLGQRGRAERLRPARLAAGPGRSGRRGWPGPAWRFQPGRSAVVPRAGRADGRGPCAADIARGSPAAGWRDPCYLLHED